MTRLTTLLVAVALATLSQAAKAQEVESVVRAPVTRPAADAEAAASPGALLGKSVRDLADGNLGAAVHDDVTALQRGPLLIHGNYCGIGNRPGARPVDALDAACKRHDACTDTGNIPNCACNDRLQAEATAIAGDPRASADLQALAAATAASMAVLICR